MMFLPTAVAALSGLANQHRLTAFRLLVRAGPAGLSAGDIAREVGLLPNTLSTHLSTLVHAGLVESRRNSRSLLYSANYAGMRELLDYLVEDCCGGHPEICAPLIARATEAACCPEPGPQAGSESVPESGLKPALTLTKDFP